ncbi:MAG TPA: energy transducer TonB [Opitutaceae bacterium]
MPALKPSSLQLAALTAALLAPVQLLAKPDLYNDRAGDGSADLDRAVRQAYSADYDVVDAGADDGFKDPVAVAGDFPRYVKDEHGQLIAGYVLIVYVVDAQGDVQNPVVVRGPDTRLCRIALTAMGDWKFKPGTLHGVAVASVAAQEFTFGPVTTREGFKLDSVTEYQPHDVIIRRIPPNERINEYIRQMTVTAHGFFVNDTRPETLSIVVVARPGGRSRIWLLPSIRRAQDLEPLKKLLLGVRPLEVKGGPVILCLTGLIAGGDGSEKVLGQEYRTPIPPEWKAFAKAMKDPPPFSSDAFLDAYWP